MTSACCFALNVREYAYRPALRYETATGRAVSSFRGTR